MQSFITYSTAGHASGADLGFIKGGGGGGTQGTNLLGGGVHAGTRGAWGYAP